MEKETRRPEYITDEHLQFLDALRESGTVNMFGASMYIENEFRLTRQVAKAILNYWMKSFGNENR